MILARLDDILPCQFYMPPVLFLLHCLAVELSLGALRKFVYTVCRDRHCKIGLGVGSGRYAGVWHNGSSQPGHVRVVSSGCAVAVHAIRCQLKLRALQACIRLDHAKDGIGNSRSGLMRRVRAASSYFAMGKHFHFTMGSTVAAVPNDDLPQSVVNVCLLL